MKAQGARNSRKRKPVTLKTIADRVGLAPCSISAVLNNSPAARGIPQRTRDRVLRAACQLKYQPNFAARSLRTRRTHSIAVLAQDLGEARIALALAGIECATRRRGYLLTVATWDGDPESLSDHLLQLRQRGIEGLVLIDTAIGASLTMPAVVIETAEAPRIDGEPTNNWRLRAEGEMAAHTLLDQIEAFARVQNNCEPPFWRTAFQDRPASLS